MSQISRRQATTLGFFMLALMGVMWVLFGALRGGDPARTAQLLTMLKSDDASTRLGAVTGLATAGGAPEALTALQSALSDGDLRVRASAAWALWRSGRPDLATPGFEALLAAADNAERMAAVRSLRALESPDTAALLRKATGDPSAGVRSEAALGLVRINDEAGFATLATALGDVRPDHRLSAARAMARVDDKRAVSAARGLATAGAEPASSLAEVVLLHWSALAATEVKALPTALIGAPDRQRITLCEAMGHLLTAGQFQAVTSGASLLAQDGKTPAAVRAVCARAAARTQTARR